MSQKNNAPNSPELSEDGFIICDGVKVCRIAEDGNLLFYDKNRHRSGERGSNNVRVRVTDLQVLALQKARVETK